MKIFTIEHSEFVSLLIKLIGWFPNLHCTEHFIDINFDWEAYRFQNVFSYRQKINLVILINIIIYTKYLAEQLEDIYSPYLVGVQQRTGAELGEQKRKMFLKLEVLWRNGNKVKGPIWSFWVYAGVLYYKNRGTLWTYLIIFK